MTELIDSGIEERWLSLIEELSSSVQGEEEFYQDKIIEAAEMFVLGFSIKDVADELQLTKNTIKTWLKKYPVLSHIIQEKVQLVRQWRIQELDRQFLKALRKSDEILSLNPVTELEYGEDGKVIPPSERVNVKLIGVQAQHARYIIDMYTKNHGGVEVSERGEGIRLSVSEDGLKHLSQMLSKKVEDSGVEVVHVVDDVERRDEPYFDRLGNPIHGKFRELVIAEDGIVCHICGNHYKHFQTHLRLKHDIDAETYCDVFMLTVEDIKNAEKSFTDE